MSNATKKRPRVNTPLCVRGKKPSVFVEILADGKIKVYGSSAAARWLGVTQQSFDRVVRRHHCPVIRPKTIYKPVSARIKEAYPELFR